jgi:ceramide glucosyltransferase
MGQLMVLRRQAIEAIGGLEVAQGQIVDDMYLGQRLHAAGYRNVSAPVTVPIIQEGLGLWEFAGIYRRWIIFSSTGLPTWSFKLSAWLRASVFWAGVALGSYAAWQGLWLAALLGWLVPVATTASINALHVAVGGAPLPLRHRWAAFALLLAGPAVLASIQSRRAVTWRGRRYDLNGRMSLAPPAPVATVDASEEPHSAVRAAPPRVPSGRTDGTWAGPEATRRATNQDESSPRPTMGPGRAGGREAA